MLPAPLTPRNTRRRSAGSRHRPCRGPVGNGGKKDCGGEGRSNVVVVVRVKYLLVGGDSTDNFQLQSKK